MHSFKMQLYLLLVLYNARKDAKRFGLLLGAASV